METDTKQPASTGGCSAPTACYAAGQRVKILEGRYRNCIGTIIHCGGDNGDYYGVIVDGTDYHHEIGYCHHELKAASESILAYCLATLSEDCYDTKTSHSTTSA